MQAGHQLIRPEDVQRLTANDRALLSSVLFVISAIPVVVFTVLFSAMSPLAGKELEFDPFLDLDNIDKRVNQTDGLSYGKIKMIKEYGGNEKRGNVPYTRELQKWYELIFESALYTNAASGERNYSGVRYRDVLEEYDDQDFPKSWPQTMSYHSYSEFRSESMQNLGWNAGYGFCLIVGVLWVCDADKWSSPLQKFVLKLLACAAGLCIGTAMVILADTYAYGPICFFIVLFPTYLLFIYEIFLTHIMSARVFMGVIPKPLFAISALLFASWLVWTAAFDENAAPAAGSLQKMLYSEAIGCKAQKEYEEMSDDYEECTQAFLMWVFPAAMALSILAYGMMGWYLDDDAEHSLPKNLGSAVIFLLFLAWCSTSISIGATGITVAFGMIVIALLFAVIIMVIGTYGVEGLNQEAEARGFAKEMEIRYGGLADWFKGFMVISMWPLMLFYFFISFVNQSVRKLNLNFSYPLGEDDKRLWLTKVTTKQIEKAKNWEWTSVLYKGMVICELSMVLSVIVSRFTQVLLSQLIEVCRTVFIDNSNCADWSSQTWEKWVNETDKTELYGKTYTDSSKAEKQWLKGTDIFRTCDTPVVGMLVVTIIVMCVGLFLFLLPPVPGVPIYLTGGIILIATGTVYDNFPGEGNLFDKTTYQEDYAEGSGFLSIAESILWCFVMSLSLKLFACTCQQMGFGKMMKQSVKIRQMVGINTHMIRTMKIILRRPGLDVAKVAILVGGPDWPTSVLCGIMGLDLLPVLFGTIPVSVLIFPTILAGTFVYIGSLQFENDSGQMEFSFPWAKTFTAVMLTVAAGVQTGSMFVAAYYLEKAVNESGDELEAMPFDEQVERADALAKSRRRRYQEVRSWVRLPTAGRVLLIAQVVLMTICGYLSIVFPSMCFRDFEVTNRVDTDLRPIAHCYREGTSSVLERSKWTYMDGENGNKEIDGEIMQYIIGVNHGGKERCGYGDINMLSYLVSTALFIIFGYYCDHLVAEDIKQNPLPEPVLDENGRLVENPKDVEAAGVSSHGDKPAAPAEAAAVAAAAAPAAEMAAAAAVAGV